MVAGDGCCLKSYLSLSRSMNCGLFLVKMFASGGFPDDCFGVEGVSPSLNDGFPKGLFLLNRFGNAFGLNSNFGLSVLSEKTGFLLLFSSN